VDFKNYVLNVYVLSVAFFCIGSCMKCNYMLTYPKCCTCPSVFPLSSLLSSVLITCDLARFV
jgi:hypothetical protein